MLTKLLPDNITQYWNAISESISKSLPPFTRHTTKRMDYILESLLKDSLQCWVLTDVDSDNRTILYALATTEIVIDQITQTKNLSIFSLFGLRPVHPELWKSGFETLRKFAKFNRCDNIIAFTEFQNVVNIVEQLGGDTSIRLLKLEV